MAAARSSGSAQNRGHRPGPGGDEAVRDETLPAQLQIDIGEGRLVAVQPVEADLGLHRDGVATASPAGPQHGQLAALDVDLQQVDAAEVRQVVQPPVSPAPGGDPGQSGKSINSSSCRGSGSSRLAKPELAHSCRV